MRTFTRWRTIILTMSMVATVGAVLQGGQGDPPKRPTAEEVVASWKPEQKGIEDLQQWTTSPKGSDQELGCTFRVVGPSYEELWNHYAGRCGVEERYQARRLLISGGRGLRGNYVVAEQPSPNAEGGRAQTLFLLRADRYAVTVTIQPSPEKDAWLGTITAVIF